LSAPTIPSLREDIDEALQDAKATLAAQLRLYQGTHKVYWPLPKSGVSEEKEILLFGDKSGWTLRLSLKRIAGVGEESPTAPTDVGHTGDLAIGIDERTAVIVTGSSFEVMGESNVLVVDARRAVLGERTDGTPPSASDMRLCLLRPGMKFDMADAKLR
jgi:hypothetical protein